MKRRLKDVPARDELLEWLDPNQLLRFRRRRRRLVLDSLQELRLVLRREPLPPEPAERRTKELRRQWVLMGQ